MKNADDGWVATREDAQHAPRAAAIRFRGVERYEHLIALHRAVHCIRRDKHVTVGCGAFALDSHKAEAVAVNIQAASCLFLLAAMCRRNGPVIAIWFFKDATRCHLCELLEQQTTLASSAETQFAGQLFVVGAALARP